MLKGIDVSYANGVVDWDTVKNHIDFAILRCGYGQDKASQDDSQFARNISECERLGIPFGVYLYSYADSIEKAQSEAQHVLRLIKGHKLAYPVYYDLEDAGTTGKCSNGTIAAIAKTFCDAIEAAGYWVGIYANLSWWNNKLTDKVFDKWVRWVAQYNSTCDYKGTYGMWQYTSSGSVPGINGRVDMDYCYDNYPSKILGKVTAPEKTIDELVQETLAGKYGNGEARKQALGDKYEEVQAKINAMYSKPAPAPKTPAKGQQVSLSNVPLYATASSSVACGKVRGTYYLWDGILINGRYRITNAASRVGVAGQVTGFISKDYIK
jgi:GH25 family lysozyme M1 (1,4-beta-N-acetylmuramidase)